jgi:hypothetical protein
MPSSSAVISVEDVGVRLGLRLCPDLWFFIGQPVVKGLPALGVPQVVGLALRGRVALVEHVIDTAVVQGVLGLKLVSTHGPDRTRAA